MLPGDQPKKSGPPKPDLVKGVEPVSFPLYSVNPAKGEPVHQSCGNLPLLMYIGKQLRPKIYNRQSGMLDSLSTLCLFIAVHEVFDSFFTFFITWAHVLFFILIENLTMRFASLQNHYHNRQDNLNVFKKLIDLN